MKKSLCLLIATCFAVIATAQDYKVGFVASGLSTTTDSVEIKNLNQNKSITVYGQDTLHLLGVVSSTESMERSTDVKLYPNPASGTSHLEFFSPEGGTAKLMISDMSGKHLLTRHLETQAGTNRIRISGLKRGTYLLALHQQNMQLTRKLTVTSGNGGILQAEISNTGTTGVSTKSVKADGLVEWQYNEGDILLFKSWSMYRSRIKVHYITSDVNLNFEFVQCQDAEGYHYTVTTINGTTWMAENLRTNRFNNNVPITRLEDFPDCWNTTEDAAYCYYNNDSVTFGELGALYNFAAATHGDLCPYGWHVPTRTEFQDMMVFLQNNGYNYDGSTDTDDDYATNDFTAKSLSADHSFNYCDTTGAPGNTDYPSYRNRSGFSALAGGTRDTINNFGMSYSRNAVFWTSSEYNSSYSMRFEIRYNDPTSHMFFASRHNGYAIRCVKD